MQITKKEMILYVIIGVIVVAVVAELGSSYLSSASPYSLNVRITQLNPTAQTYPYQTGRFKVNVQNTGATLISGMQLSTYINGDPQQNYKISIPAGENASFLFNYTFIANGTYLFQAIADPGHEFNIVNRNTSTGSVTVKALAAEQPNVYTSMPNTNITGTESFSLKPNGTDQAVFFATNYSISEFNRMFDNSNNAILSIFTYTFPYIATVNGAYTEYANSSTAYSAWMQGTINSSAMYGLMTYIGLKTKNLSNGAVYSRYDSNTSICSIFQGGWIKLVSYDNASASPQTCANLIATNYNATESTTLINLLKNDNNIRNYSTNFNYSDSQIVGDGIEYSGNSIGTFNLFQNSYGFFSGLVKRNAVTLDVNALNLTCIGYVFTNQTGSVCSEGVGLSHPPYNVSYVMANSSEIAANYTATVYSLTSRTYITSAQEAASHLIAYKNIQQPIAIWNKNIANTCKITTTNSLTCLINSFNVSSSAVNFSLTNLFGRQIRINTAACYVPGFQINATENITLNNNAAAPIALACIGTIPGISGSSLLYNVSINYTVNGNIGLANGIISVADTGT